MLDLKIIEWGNVPMTFECHIKANPTFNFLYFFPSFNFSVAAASQASIWCLKSCGNFKHWKIGVVEELGC